METEELTKLVDGIYKNILDKFNPGARQMINAGKAYLKALHGAAAASRLYVEAITKLARQAQQGTWGGSSDIGTALMQVVEVYKEIQAQQMNILKAFYVDLLVPLETNLEKDTKVVQSEQKKFLQQHKARSETYSKAAANMKKHRKKGIKSGSKTGLAMDKELKNMQILEEEKSKLDIFCEQSLKNAMTQERRRYGFVLERQCSLAKHYLAYHTAGVTSYGRHLDEWQDIARTREYLPESVDNMFTTKLRQVSFWQDDDAFSSRGNMDDDRISVASQLRKTKSMDASCLDVRSINDVTSPMKPLSRAKSEYNLNSSTHSLVQEDPCSPQRPKSMAIPEKPSWESPLARALYAYLSSGDNQLSFLEGDVIALLGDRNKGWQFGENLRTQCSGWFPLAYTELITDDTSVCSPTHRRMDSMSTTATTPGTPGLNSNSNSNSGKPSPTTMFGDTLLHRRVVKQVPHRAPHITSASLGPPPSLPAPIPELSQHAPRSITTTAIVHPPQPLLSPRGDAATLPGKRGTVHPPPMPPLPLHLGGKRANGAPGSLHSSNDSGFSNDPPPQPEVDYSDDDSARAQQTRHPPNPGSDATKKQLLSSVRGWLLYKSALDLWDDVNEQNAPKPMAVTRTMSVRENLEQGGTLGRFNSQDLLKPTPVAVDKAPDVPNKATVKRTKSLWKFKRSNKNEILEGMSLWKHRSLIDVYTAKDEEIIKSDDKDEEEEKTENIYASAENIQAEKQKYIEKINNEKNAQSPEEKNYYSDVSGEPFGIGDGSDSVIVVNDHINVSKRKNRSKFEVSNRSDITQSDVFNGNGKSEVSNSRSDISDTETIHKDSFLPRTKLMKSNSNDLTTQYVVRDPKHKEYQTWNANYKLREGKKWHEEENRLIKENSNNKLKDAPKLFQEQLRLSDKAKYGPWYDLWGIDSSVKT